MSQGDHGGMNMPPGSMPMSNSSSSGYDGMNMKMMMHMSFYWGKDAIILFSSWPEQRLSMYVLALFFVFLLALAVEVLSISPAIKTGTNPIVGGGMQATIYGLKMALAYMVMLSIMSFNVGVFIVAVIGHAFGFFLVKNWALAAANKAAAASSSAAGDAAKV
ncbi:copper transporter 6-like [Rhodamnia argentea]|uniref:Copper transport protein n=1 Tax=Rhodamnia argentea TaxID=178133 RepID=A0A8B8PAY3_9MYRT|nr:copper transporter 6-like [Rhodamnia argentea]